MTLLTSVAALQYKAWRYPSQLVETRVVSPLLPQTSGVRIAYERALGTLDATVGALLGDEGLMHRGGSLRERAHKAENVVAIQAAAAARRDHEAAVLEEKRAAEETRKAQVEREHELEAARHKAEARAIERKAAERRRADEGRVRDASEVILSAERDRLDAEQAEAEARVAVARTARAR